MSKTEAYNGKGAMTPTRGGRDQCIGHNQEFHFESFDSPSRKDSFWSRVSNAEVKKLARPPRFSETVRSSQSKLLGQVLIDPHKGVLRDVAFHAGDILTSETSAYVRRVGRPKQNLTDQQCSLVRQVASSAE